MKIWKFRLRNRILHPKISLNAEFQLDIPFNREVINIWLILGVFGTKWTTRRHRCASILKYWNFRLHNQIRHPKVSQMPSFGFLFPLIEKLLTFDLFWGYFVHKWTTRRGVTGVPQLWRFETFDYTIQFYIPKLA